MYLDDAHGFGVLGESGRGTKEHFGLSGAERLIEMGTLSKALGSMGGYVAASEPVCAVLRQRARSFVFTHGLPPSALAAALENLRILRKSPELPAAVRANARRLRGRLSGAGLAFGGGARGGADCRGSGRGGGVGVAFGGAVFCGRSVRAGDSSADRP